MRIFAIGDIHGRFDLLENLLNILFVYHNLNPEEDKLIFMGDYIDRGPDSLQVLEKLYELQSIYPSNVVCLLGNHEQMMLDHYYHRKMDTTGLWLANGGKATLASFGGIDNVSAKFLSVFNFDYLAVKCPKHLLKWVKHLPYYHKEPGFWFSHAPIPSFRAPRNRGKRYTKNECTWSYGHGQQEWIHATKFKKGVIGVCGHVHALFDGIWEPRIYDHYIFTDAGCGCHKNAPLCAVEVISKQVIFSLPEKFQCG